MSAINYSETINYELLRQYYEILGQSGLEESLTTLKTLMPSYYQSLQQLSEAQDEHEFRRQAHKMKGACRSLGFARMGDAMAFLEKEDWQWGQAQEIMALWQDWLEADVPAVEAWLQAQ